MTEFKTRAGMNRRAILSSVLATLTVGGLPPARAQTSYLAQIRQRGNLRIAGVVFVPFISKRPNGDWVGIDVDILTRFAQSLGVGIEFVETQWSTIVPGLQTSRWDITPATGINAQRAEVVDFSIPLARGGGVATFLRTNAKLKVTEDLDKPDVTFAVVAGGWKEPFVRERFPKAQLRVFPQATEDQMVLEVISGRADVTILDAPISPPRFDALYPNRLGFLPGQHDILPGHIVEQAYGLPKGAADLKQALDTHLRALAASGELARMYEKHMPGLRPQL